ncbi:MAG: alcohol dehydrogenase family protein [bacterium]
MSVMRAFVLTGHGGLDKLEYREDVPKPRAGAGEVLIKVAACGLNNTDINTRTAWYSKGVRQGTTAAAAVDGFADAGDDDGGWGGRIGFPRIQGADVCGVAEACGDGVAPAVRARLIGRRVMVDPWLRDDDDPGNLDAARFFGSEVDGGFAEYAVAPARNVYPIDSDCTDAELATFGCAYTTAANLLRRSALADGECVVVSGASGGVGSAAIQLAKLRGARVIALSGDDKADALRELGADRVLARDGANLREAIAELAPNNNGDNNDSRRIFSDRQGAQRVREGAYENTQPSKRGGATPHSGKKTSEGGADVVLDVVGGALFPRLIDCLRRGGRYAASGAIAGAMVALDLRTLYLNDLQILGATVVPPEVFPRLLREIEAKRLRPLLARAFPLRELAAAQRMFIDKKHVGNIVVTMRDDAI